jgi:hypothetical protein
MRVHDESRNNAAIPPRIVPARYEAPMKDAAAVERKVLAGPQCEKCGGPTRIMRIEPHKRFKRRHVWTLECLGCGAAQAANMPAPRSTH